MRTKTEIFKIGNQKETINKAFSEKIKCQVRILGAIFCKKKEDETKLNFEAVTNTLKAMKENYGTSLMGKILNINTYIYSQIWNNAYIINTKDKHYKNCIKDIENYLQPTKGDEILEHAERRINEGGLNLINITERIETLKLREIIEADTKLPETDNIVHMIGTRDKQIYGKTINGPKAESNTEQEKKAIKRIEEKQESLTNYKKRHKKLITKDIQRIMFPKEKKTPF